MLLERLDVRVHFRKHRRLRVAGSILKDSNGLTVRGSWPIASISGGIDRSVAKIASADKATSASASADVDNGRLGDVRELDIA